MGRVDLHCHLLPGVDDGPAEMEASVRMARIAAEDGTEVIVATPHHEDVSKGAGVGPLRELADRFASAVQTSLEGSGARLRVLLGMENHLVPELPDRVGAGLALPLAGTRYILCEPPTEMYPLYLDDTLFRLQQRGLIPVIAHPERCLPFQQRPERLAALVSRGMLAQITGSSLLDEFGGAARRSAETLIRRGLVHVISSDMHRPERMRLPNLSKAHARAASLIGQERAGRLFDEIPRAIVEGREPDLEPPAEAPARRWWSFGRRISGPGQARW